MVRKKIDNRIRVLIENGIKLGHRTLFVVVGDKAKDQVVILHHMLSKAEVKARPSVLWCYKKELGFSSNQKKRMKHLQQKIKAGKLSINEDDPFELFLSSTKIRYCYYSETHKILGNTYGMCVLQDFEALTPNLLARTIETVEGGGLVVLLLRSITSLKQLYTLSMDVHKRFRTEAHQDVRPRFNERFLLSLASCRKCLIVTDQLTVLPVSTHAIDVTPIENTQQLTDVEMKLNSFKEKVRDTPIVGSLMNCCKTLDQFKALLKFTEAIAEKTLRSTVSLTAARGRGKSAALGLAVSAAVAFGYSNIYVTSPSPENLNTFFEFVFKGFDALEYQEHIDYSLVQSTNPEFNKAIIRVSICRDRRQTIQYIHPTDANKLCQAELLVIDEAAAIPIPYVKAMLGPYLVFLASTVNGYEGTGRSLSLKLLEQLRIETVSKDANTKAAGRDSFSSTGRTLHEITLNESIRYKPDDDVELWLTKLLCLDSTAVTPILSGYPAPNTCNLYYINRDTLFSYHKASEEFLQRLVALYVTSHYKNSPNDLQMMSDAPAHHLFCLLGPVDPNSKILPEVLVFIQVCLEGEISKASVKEGFARGKRASGDLIPWTIGQQYQDTDFPRLAGARIVRIATHPNCQGMGYGFRALQLLKQYYEQKIPCYDEPDLPSQEIETVDEDTIGLLKENIEARKSLPPLLLNLSERRPEKLDYIGVSFGLTEQLLKFWKRADFVPVYLRQTTNDLTGEHSCIMLSVLNLEQQPEHIAWLNAYWCDFRNRFINLLRYEFSKFSPNLALSVLINKAMKMELHNLSKQELMYKRITPNDVKKLEMYGKNLVDYRFILNLLGTLGRLFFFNQMGDMQISAVQSAILLGLGLQYKTFDQLAFELDLPATQLLGLFKKLIKKFEKYLNFVIERDVENLLQPQKDLNLASLTESLNDELEAAKQSKTQKKELEKLKSENLEQFAIKGSEEEWSKALMGKSKKTIISVKSGEKRLHENNRSEIVGLEAPATKKKKQKNKKK
ncbi:hypothetical protein ABEB36_005733 [Hypothenemus hampei]|uniref:RNA cytidine acetyltransferase n=1 Tax=Hypothenemus hampei TaxID=57062 RepID=A0ABD1EZ89_HYPHA